MTISTFGRAAARSGIATIAANTKQIRCFGITNSRQYTPSDDHSDRRSIIESIPALKGPTPNAHRLDALRRVGSVASALSDHDARASGWGRTGVGDRAGLCAQTTREVGPRRGGERPWSAVRVHQLDFNADRAVPKTRR